MNIIKMIVGLSNPLKGYINTRHNIGNWYIQLLAKHCRIRIVEEKKFFGFTSYISMHGYYIRLLIPNIFMNINGKSIYKMASFYGIRLHEILIVHDDLDLEPGVVKLKYSYGHGGHNGLRNVIYTFGKKNNFYRFRIGIGRPIKTHEIASFVLSCPTHAERVLIKKAILHAIDETFILIQMNNQSIKKAIL